MRNKMMKNAIERFNHLCDKEAKEQGLSGKEYRDQLFDNIDNMPKPSQYGFDEAINGKSDIAAIEFSSADESLTAIRNIIITSKLIERPLI